jgi:hypothetical protein
LKKLGRAKPPIDLLDPPRRTKHMPNDKNIFQIWKEQAGEKTPFAVRRAGWANIFYTVVEMVEIGKYPSGKAYGFPVANGRYSSHYQYDAQWRRSSLIPSAGSYQWELVLGVELDRKKLASDQNT